ncbi:MAG: hypothetical protein HW421_3260 [Ignavibacteria bacterium]|nr:hypothetical protein [Ignavibacteria bacterium]
MQEYHQSTEPLTFEKVWAMFQETRQSMNQTDKQIKETDKQIKELGKQIGGLANKFGSFNEGLVMPSLHKILLEKFNCNEAFENYTYKNNGDILEIDMLGIAEDATYIIEIKSHFRDEAIEQIIREAAQFRKFSKYSKDKKIFCFLAATHYKDEEQKKVLNEGIYFISISDDVAKLKVPKNFKPKEW